MSPRDDLNRLQDILDAIERIEHYAADGLPGVREDPWRRRIPQMRKALERVIGTVREQ
ncbi:MAG: hypothetical protein M3217_11645 [Actinomycetota bacterium]|nr:hypothetical protein [Actinomycetota bacterium]